MLLLRRRYCFYACTGSGVDSLGLNGWSQFVADFRIASKKYKFCKQADVDRLYAPLTLHVYRGTL